MVIGGGGGGGGGFPLAFSQIRLLGRGSPSNLLRGIPFAFSQIGLLGVGEGERKPCVWPNTVCLWMFLKIKTRYN